MDDPEFTKIVHAQSKALVHTESQTNSTHLPSVFDSAVQGKKIAVVTSRTRPTAEKYTRLTGIFDLIDALLTPDSTQNHKPHPGVSLPVFFFFTSSPIAFHLFYVWFFSDLHFHRDEKGHPHSQPAALGVEG